MSYLLPVATADEPRPCVECGKPAVIGSYYCRKHGGATATNEGDAMPREESGVAA